MTEEEYKAFRKTVIHLKAAISLLENGGVKAVGSDKMFKQMLKDYKVSVDNAVKILKKSS